MIKFCHISPTHHLQDFCSDNKAHLVLAHLVEQDEKYAYWYKQRKEYKILDNSCFEMYKQGKEMYASEKLIEMGHKVKADIIVMSDYPAEPAQKTIDAAEQLGPIFHAAGFEAFFCPQSEIGNMRDYLDAWEYAVTSPNVDTIGVSILGVPNAFGNIEKNNKLQRFLSRWKMMDILDKEGYLVEAKINNKKLHFLGMLDGPNEIKLVEEFHMYIDSWDSSTAVWCGLNNIRYDNSPTGLINGKFEEEVNFNFHTSDKTLIDKVHYNKQIIEGMTKC